MDPSTADLLRFLRRLRATKVFTDEPVSDEAVQDILEVGRWSASGSNRQPTEVIVVRDQRVRQQFADWVAKPAATAPVVLLIVTTQEAFAFDEGRLAERLALAAAAHGLGSTIATLKEAGPEAVKPLLGIPADRRARTVVAIGHPDEARRFRSEYPGSRKPMAEFAHRGRYGTPL